LHAEIRSTVRQSLIKAKAFGIGRICLPQRRQEEVRSVDDGAKNYETERRKYRVRRQLRKVANGRPRLSIFRSSKHIYAQVIDDGGAAHWLPRHQWTRILPAKKGAMCEAAALVGKYVAERAGKAGVTDVVFDRGSYLYHGRVKALAEAAREAGLNF
jgi:large subunit ribosomal protein L18